MDRKTCRNVSVIQRFHCKYIHMYIDTLTLTNLLKSAGSTISVVMSASSMEIPEGRGGMGGLNTLIL